MKGQFLPMQPDIVASPRAQDALLRLQRLEPDMSLTTFMDCIPISQVVYGSGKAYLPGDSPSRRQLSWP